MRLNPSLAGIVLGMLTMAPTVWGEQKTFSGTSDYDWKNDANWTPPGVPSEADEVLIAAADVQIGPNVQAVAASVTIAGDGDTRILTIAKSGHLLVAGPITLGGDLPETISMLRVAGALSAARVEMSPGDGKSAIVFSAADTLLNLGDGKGEIIRAGGRGLSSVEFQSDGAVLELASVEVNSITLGQDDHSGILAVTEGQVWTAEDIFVGNGLAGATGTGTLNIDGGTVTAKRLILNSGADGVANHFVVNLNSGTLKASAILRKFDGGTQAFNWNGGTIANVETADLVISSAAKQPLIISIAGSGTHAFDVSDGSLARIQPTAILADITAEHGTLSKAGAGRLEIEGACTYSGATTVGEGELLLSGEGSISCSSGVSVARSATFTNESTVALPAKVGWLKK